MAQQATDEQLISSALAGEEAAFGALMKRYRPRAYGLALRFTRDQDEAEEVVQEVFFNIFRKLDQFRGNSSFATWLYRVVVNTSLMKIRQRSKIDSVPLCDLIEGQLQEEDETSVMPDERLVTEEALAEIEKAIAKLPEDFMTVLVLRDVENFSNEETAEIMDLSVAAVKSRLHRARSFLRQHLEDLYLQTMR